MIEIPATDTKLEGDALRAACADMDRLPMWVLHYDPKDFPGKYVARLTFTFGPTEITSTYFVGDEVDQVAYRIPFMGDGRWRWLGRMAGDEPQILGVWL